MKGMPAGEKVRKLRDLRGWSEEWMAQQLGMSQRQYSRYETGEAELKISLLDAISKLFGITTIDLLSFDERVFFSNCEQAHAFGSNNTYNASSLKEREQYEARIRHLEDEVAFLRSQLEKALSK